MRRFFSWQVVLGIIFIGLSAGVYLLHYWLFRDAHHIFLYLVGDIAFVFLEVFLVTMVLHQLLAFREKRALLKKLNMVIGSFFSEAGRELIGFCAGLDANSRLLADKLIVNDKWTGREFEKIGREISTHSCAIDCKRGDLEKLKDFLLKKRGFLLLLLENPNLLEHESFTDLLWAVFHFSEELEQRRGLASLSQKDYEHLSNDVKRVYLRLISQWLEYMRHLQRDYPYLFSLAVRTNPFDPAASVEIK
jgi:hypothetical protein